MRPFWKKAEELGALVLIHPNGFTEGKRFSRFYFNNVIGNPLETTIALHYLIFDGVLERHPKLKILAVHGGGYPPRLFGPHRPRLGRALGCHGNLPKPPTSYLKQVYFDTVVFTPHQLAELVRLSASITSSWARTIRSTWRTSTRSVISLPLTLSILLRWAKSWAATRNGYSDYPDWSGMSWDR